MPDLALPVIMIDLPYSLVIEATRDPGFFGFYSLELEAFTGVGHSVEDCLYKARCGMDEHVAILEEKPLLRTGEKWPSQDHDPNRRPETTVT
jgi:predicted RNase H-like HicB family nuclease